MGNRFRSRSGEVEVPELGWLGGFGLVGGDIAKGVDVGEGAFGRDVDVALGRKGSGGDKEDGLREDPREERGRESGVEFAHLGWLSGRSLVEVDCVVVRKWARFAFE